MTVKYGHYLLRSSYLLRSPLPPSVFELRFDSFDVAAAPYACSVRFRVHSFTSSATTVLFCRFQGHQLYGIKSVAVYADRLSAVVSDCATAAKSSDARDKYFLSYVTESDPFPAKSLRSELPALESAQASLATTTSELADVLPRLALCRAGAMNAISAVATKQKGHTSTRVYSALNVASSRVSAQSGFDQDAVVDLLQEARASIIGVRKVLA